MRNGSSMQFSHTLKGLSFESPPANRRRIVMVMDYIQRFIKAYLDEGITEVEFEDLSEKYKPMYAEIR